MDMILRINMGADGGPSASVEEMGEFAGLGGRAMTSLIVAKEVDPTCHPLGAGNKLVFAPGMLTGSAASTSGRISVGCKSPLTGGIKEANAGGQAGQALARLGYAASSSRASPRVTTSGRSSSTRTVSRSRSTTTCACRARTTPSRSSRASTATR